MFVRLPWRLRDKCKALGMNVGGEPDGYTPSTFQIDLRTINKTQHNMLYEMLKAEPDSRSIRSTMNAYIKSLEDSSTPNLKVDKFNQLAVSLQKYLIADAKEGWIFKIGDHPNPALVLDVQYFPEVKKRDYERDAYVEITAMTNNRGTTNKFRLSLERGKFRGLTPADALYQMGYVKETDELHEDYQTQLSRYKAILPLYGKQLVLVEEVGVQVDGEVDEESYYRRRKKIDVALKSDNGGKLVHDEAMNEDKLSVSSYRYDDPSNPYISEGMKALIEQDDTKSANAFTRAPISMYLKAYHLGRHHDMTVHVQQVEIYKYDKTIRQKLILPGMYNEVLDVLTHDMLLVQEDMVAGKTGGNVVLLAGAPGLGKTLTAEVYAEHKEVPLLKIHSGQLGTDAGTIEKRLTLYYKRATAWGIPVLLDEFDVFGRARGDNLEQNAVVAVFLRTLEYQNNTIFLTTNRADTMDDAILSRCAAIIKFELPVGDELLNIWRVQRNQYLKSLPDEAINELMDYFKAEGKTMSGRDVKNIMRLASRYETTGRKVDKDLLITCAGFRGV